MSNSLNTAAIRKARKSSPVVDGLEERQLLTATPNDIVFLNQLIADQAVTVAPAELNRLESILNGTAGARVKVSQTIFNRADSYESDVIFLYQRSLAGSPGFANNAAVNTFLTANPALVTDGVRFLQAQRGTLPRLEARIYASTTFLNAWDIQTGQEFIDTVSALRTIDLANPPTPFPSNPANASLLKELNLNSATSRQKVAATVIVSKTSKVNEANLIYNSLYPRTAGTASALDVARSLKTWNGGPRNGARVIAVVSPRYAAY